MLTAMVALTGAGSIVAGEGALSASTDDLNQATAADVTVADQNTVEVTPLLSDDVDRETRTVMFEQADGYSPRASDSYGGGRAVG